MSPVDFICWDCGSDFEVGVRETTPDSPPVTCPICGSDLIAADFAAIERWRPAEAGATHADGSPHAEGRNLA